jgi:hypothetical protein
VSSGIIYLRARYYDPTTAQFLTRDPIEQLTQQPYQYANGDPLDQVDPLGLCGHWYDVACQVGSAATAVGGAIVDNAGTLSTVASGLATVAYAGCIVTDGVGCGVGALLSGASTALSGIAAEQACFGGAGGCASAATSFALSAVATVSGGLANAAAKGALANAENAYARDVLLYRQYAKVGFLSNGVQTRVCLAPGTDLACAISAGGALAGRILLRGHRRGAAGEDAADVVTTAAGFGYGRVVAKGMRVLRRPAGRAAYKLHSSLGDVFGAVFGFLE